MVVKISNAKPERKAQYINNKLYSLFLKFSALGLLQDIRNNFHS